MGTENIIIKPGDPVVLRSHSGKDAASRHLEN